MYVFRMMIMVVMMVMVVIMMMVMVMVTMMMIGSEADLQVTKGTRAYTPLIQSAAHSTQYSMTQVL